jgi:hypothetical protein
MSDREPWLDTEMCTSDYKGSPCGCPLSTMTLGPELRQPYARCVGCGDLHKLDAEAWARVKRADDAYEAHLLLERRDGPTIDAMPERVREANARLLREHGERERAAAMRMAELAEAQCDLFGGAA